MIIGVDPGLSGAISFVDNNSILHVTDMPVMDGRIDATSLASMILEFPKADFAVVEKVSSMPGQGVSSTFKFGQSYGTILGVLGALNIRVVHVSPRKWKNDFHLGSDKEKARSAAIDRWPENSEFFKRKKDHGRAEACLIAVWGSLNA